ncbi:MAG: peptidase T [Pirellulales bacterium]
MIQSERLLDRFLRYIRVSSPANPASDDYPSSPGQLELGALLTAELQAMGAEDVEHDQHGLVWATVPATIPGNLPTILFNAHLDTSPEAPAVNVRPQVVRDYSGGDIRLPGTVDKTISPQNSPVLNQLMGHTLVTTNGLTLLGGDDKAGVAAIMELAQHLIENPHLPHGPVRVLFTCDEEIGRGAKHMNIAKAAATAAYTLDGGGQCEVENETFSADMLEVIVSGYNIHPAIAQGKMINAARGLCLLLSQLPTDRLTPETTSGKEGFLHPFQISGGVSEARANVLLRDFNTQKLDDYANLVQAAADQVCQQIPGLKTNIHRIKQYRNMAEVLNRFPEVVEFAMEAHQQLGQTPHLGSIRGGTDGAQFSALSLPTPNLSVGQHNIHSVLEFASLNQMTYAVEHAIRLLEIWAKRTVS